jgi:hypothetical protein
MMKWISEGRVSGDCLVWRDGWRDWMRASQALAGIGGTSAVGAPQEGASPSPVAGLAGGDARATVVGAESRYPRRYRSRSMTLAVVVFLVLASLALLVGLVFVIQMSAA